MASGAMMPRPDARRGVAGRPAFTAGPPRLLYEGRYDTSVTNTPSYDVSLYGRRFLRAQPPESGQAATQIQVVINWGEEVKRRVVRRFEGRRRAGLLHPFFITNPSK